jgi:hypothetical protein
MEFEAAIELEVTKRFPNNRVLDVFASHARFDMAIHNTPTMLEERRQMSASEIAIFIDRRGEDSAAMSAIPRGIVGAAAEEGEAIGSATDDHSVDPLQGCGIRARSGDPSPEAKHVVKSLSQKSSLMSRAKSLRWIGPRECVLDRWQDALPLPTSKTDEELLSIGVRLVNEFTG